MLELMKISEGSPSTQHIFITHFWMYLRFQMYIILVAVILAKLEGLEDLAFFWKCYIIELNPGLGLRSLGSVPKCHLLTMRVGKLYHFSR